MVYYMFVLERTAQNKNARVAQLVERDLAKVEAAGSSPVSRSENKKDDTERYRPFCFQEQETDGELAARQPPRRILLTTVFGGGWRGCPKSHEIMT